VRKSGLADFALGLICAAQRKIVAADRFVRKGAWIMRRFGNSRRVTVRRFGSSLLRRMARGSPLIPSTRPPCATPANVRAVFIPEIIPANVEQAVSAD
jgi:hypothetical protein